MTFSWLSTIGKFVHGELDLAAADGDLKSFEKALGKAWAS
jgi:hypothetical protein